MDVSRQCTDQVCSVQMTGSSGLVHIMSVGLDVEREREIWMYLDNVLTDLQVCSVLMTGSSGL